MPARLVITDGTTEINLLDQSWGYHLSGWEPAVAQYKMGGTFSDSPLADGRRLTDRHFDNAYETFELKANSPDQDTLIRDLQELRRLLEKAASYWASDWQDEPVWIEARASRETNLRYSLVVAGAIASDDDPFQMPFLQPDCSAVMDDLVLVVERESFWRADQPGTGTCVPMAGYGEYCVLPGVYFNGSTTDILVPDNAAIQDLHDGAMTVEAWIYPHWWGEGGVHGFIVAKGLMDTDGWRFILNGPNAPYSQETLEMYIMCATQDARSRSAVGEITIGIDLWYHVATTWDDASYNYPRLWINGAESAYDGLTQNRNGAIISDVGRDLHIGNEQRIIYTFNGVIGWVRVSDVIRYTGTFTPPPRCVLPGIDANTVGQWIGAEWSGATIDNQEGTAAIDGTLANGAFRCACERLYGNVEGGLATCSPGFLEFNGLNSVVTVSDDATLQDLADAAMTVEGWFRADVWDDYYLVSKQDIATTTGWRFYITDFTNRIVADINCVTDAAYNQAAYATPDGTWHHLAFTWDDATYLRPRIWIDGVEGTYEAGQNRNGAIVSDVGDDLLIGDAPTGGGSFEGAIGWVRVSDSVRYTTTFTPPERCTLPTVDGNTVWLGIQEGYGLTVYDQSGNGNDGAISICTWGCDCVEVDEESGEPEVSPTCEDEG